MFRSSSFSSEYALHNEKQGGSSHRKAFMPRLYRKKKQPRFDRDCGMNISGVKGGKQTVLTLREHRQNSFIMP